MRSDTTPGFRSVRPRFPMFVDDTGLTPRTYTVGAPSLFSGYSIFLFLFLYFPLYRYLYPSFLPSRSLPLSLALPLSLFLFFPLSRSLSPVPSLLPLSLRFCRPFRSALLAITTNARRSMGHKCASRQRDSRPRVLHRTEPIESGNAHGCRVRKRKHTRLEQRATLTAVILAGISNEKARWVH